MAIESKSRLPLYSAAMLGFAVGSAVMAAVTAQALYYYFNEGNWSKDLGEGRQFAYSQRFFLRAPELIISQTSSVDGERKSLKLSKVRADENGKLSIRAVGQNALDQTLDHLRRVCIITDTQPIIETAGTLSTTATTPDTSCIGNRS